MLLGSFTEFAPVEEVVRTTVAEGREVGLQVAVAVGGEIVFETAAGVADTTTGEAVDASTLFPIFSATKGVAATALHLQAERGLLDYDRPIVEIWPEFAAGDKARATVRHALLHQVGIPQMPSGITVEQMCDWDHMARAVADLPALWEPGTRMGYHAYTFGWIVGELVRRADPDARSIGRVVAEDIAGPLGATDIWIGIPEGVEARIARLKEGRPGPPPPGDTLIGRAIPAHLWTSQDVFGRSDVRRSEHPAAGGIANARSLAKMYAMLAAGGVARDRRLLSTDRVLAASATSCDDVDVVLGRRITRGLGYWVGGDPNSASAGPMGVEATSFGHSGAGGSIAWADRRRGAGIALLKNLMLSPATAADNPLTAVADAIRDALDRRRQSAN